jgi:hypothetical protein
VAIIRQVEVDITNEIDQQKGNHKEERSKLKLWSGKAKEVAQLIQQRDGEREHSSTEGGKSSGACCVVVPDSQESTQAEEAGQVGEAGVCWC